VLIHYIRLNNSYLNNIIDIEYIVNFFSQLSILIMLPLS